MKSRRLQIKEVYVWELPVRIYHWLNALCILTLCLTGYVIAEPVAVLSAGEANFSYWFGTVRFVHFAAAYIFLFNFAFRIYWGFAGNSYANWRNYIPLKKSQWQELLDVIRVDILMLKNKPVDTIGHNTLASVIYFAFFCAFALQCITGFALYAGMSRAFFPQLFARIVPLVGGDLLVRQIHHFLMWFFILFSIIHVYLVFYHDYIERHGVASSIIGGWKFIEEKKTLILGLGNLLLKDEGAGIHAIRALGKETLPPGIDLLDGGTGGLQLLGRLADYGRIIMIDATTDHHPPGYIRRIRPRNVADYPPLMSAHEIGIRDMIEAMMLSGHSPEIDLLLVSVGNVGELGVELTPPVAAALPEIVRRVKLLVQ